jgi:hypothetical protein
MVFQVYFGFLLIFILQWLILHNAAFILLSGFQSCSCGDKAMRVHWILFAILSGAPFAVQAQVQVPASPGKLVAEVVYNELHDHQLHGYWRYWIDKHAQKQNKLEEQVETADGPVTRLLSTSGRPLSAADEESERARLDHWLNSPQEQQRHRQDYAVDENRIGRILALLPQAFLFADIGGDSGCAHLRFWPNPDYPTHSIEARIFRAMHGELWVDLRSKRLARLDGQLEENVDFGYGILGRIYRGSWFLLQRTQVSATDWKTQLLEVHMNGRAFFLKTISRETSEVRGGFAPVPPGLSLAQGMKLLFPPQAKAAVAPAAFPAVR